jgi:intein/homing endonuclease
MKKIVLALMFCFSLLITIQHVYGSPQGYVLKESEKSKITAAAYDVFLSQNSDFHVSIKDVYKSYKEYRKANKISNKAKILVEKKFFEDFKEDYYEYISLEQQKEIEAAYRAVIRAKKAADRVFENEIKALYKLGKVKRNHYKNKESGTDYKIEKAKKHFDAVCKAYDIAIAKVLAAENIYIAKAKIIGEGDNIFTRIKKLQEGNK